MNLVHFKQLLHTCLFQFYSHHFCSMTCFNPHTHTYKQHYFKAFEICLNTSFFASLLATSLNTFYLLGSIIYFFDFLNKSSPMILANNPVKIIPYGDSSPVKGRLVVTVGFFARSSSLVNFTGVTGLSGFTKIGALFFSYIKVTFCSVSLNTEATPES